MTYTIYQPIGAAGYLYNVGTFIHLGKKATLSQDFYATYDFVPGPYYLAKQVKGVVIGEKFLVKK